MTLADHACRFYQTLFAGGHPEQAGLVALHRAGTKPGADLGEFHAAYFAHEYEKGAGVVRRFQGVTREWEGGRALDFGAGGGGLTVRIRDHAGHATGLDVDPAKLAFARQAAADRGVTGVDFVAYDGDLPCPLPAGGFDVVFCVDVVEHLPDPGRFFPEFRRLLRPGGLLLLSFGPPWGHAHGKHMWTQLPGWWTHLLFPRRTVMRAIGHPPETTWADLGLHRLTVGAFERIIQASGFETVHQELKSARPLALLKRLPLVRELVISEVVGVYRNPV